MTSLKPGKSQGRLMSASNIKNILNPLGPFSKEWDTIFLLSTVIAVSLDPLFFYLPVVNEDKKCLFMDRKLGTAATVLRLVMDGLSIVSVACRVYFPPKKRNGSSATDARSIASSTLRFFLVDILAVLPLPQVVVLVIIPMMGRVELLDAMNSLIIVVSCQSIPRVLRVFPLLKKDKRTSGRLAEAAWAKAAGNLFLYMLAGHALGALWYFLAIQRQTVCWLQACANHTGCVKRSFYCDDSVGVEDHTFINASCPISNTNSELFDFGIFLDALQADIVKVVNFPVKFFHCFHWGLQNLSFSAFIALDSVLKMFELGFNFLFFNSFGQNLRTSTSIWENCLAVSITIFGLLLFLSLIGNVQIYMQSETMKLEELRLKTREIEQWKPFKKLPGELQKEIKKYQRYKWQESRGVDVEILLKNFPKEMIKKIKRELCLELLMKVELFSCLGIRMLNELCYHAKPVLLIDRSIISHEGDPIDEMLFIVQGTLKTHSKSSGCEKVAYLKDGDYCGEELLDWVREFRYDQWSLPLPISSRNIQALSKVEAFSLLATDLESVYTWAAMVVQSTYRRRHKKRIHYPIEIAGAVDNMSASDNRTTFPDRLITTGHGQGNSA